MKINIVGKGAFGTFLTELLNPHFELTDTAETVVLAVPASSYDSCGRYYSTMKNAHLVNVCSIQKPTMDTLLKYTHRVTGIHPLFGRRTPSDKRNSILTYKFKEHDSHGDEWYSEPCDCEQEFLTRFSNISKIFQSSPNDPNIERFTPESHDILMAKTHASSVMAAKQLKVFTDRVKDVPDELIPNSFRLMRDFVKTLDDMPQGTIESILSNPYI